MSGADWNRAEVEAIVEDYLAMLAAELSGVAYNKSAHNKSLLPKLAGRSKQSVEYKHANISAALLDAGFPYINGYKPRPNYQALLAEVLAEKLARAAALLEIASSDADRPTAVPEVDNILAVLTEAPIPTPSTPKVGEAVRTMIKLSTNYVEREARNRSLGSAGELFVIEYERARLVRAGFDSLAAKIEHTSRVRGDYEGYDILSFEESGAERLIEVKTTKYGKETPFFVTKNEVSVSERHSDIYQVYRMFDFRKAPHLYTLPGAIPRTCLLTAASFLARPR